MKTMVQLSHEFLLPVLHKQAIVVDATLGQGKDTEFFLNQKVKTVIAFEVQEAAIQKVKDKIKDDRLHIYNTGHENMDAILSQKVDAMVFNFGYCPGLDSCVTTMPNTSLTAVKKGLNLLKVKGRMALAFYPHEQGRLESEKIMGFLQNVPHYSYQIQKIEVVNAKSPYLIFIERIH